MSYNLKRTGLNRRNILEYNKQIILGMIKHMDENGMPQLPFQDQEIKYRYTCCPGEAFERSMVAAAFYAQATKTAEIDGVNYIEKWLTGLKYITDPKSEGYWDSLGDYSPIGSQIAFSILLAREYFWEPLTEKEKENVAIFLDKSARNDSYDNNHYFFHMMPLKIIEECNIDSNRPKLEEMFERSLNWYRGDGWFIDGANKSFDWYNNHGFHLYLQMLYYFDDKIRDKFGEEIREITKQYLENFPLLFDSNGYALPQGRSLSYRFVNISPIGWMIANDMWTKDLGLAKGIVNRTLKLFFENNCLTDDKLLAPGYFGENKKLKESYLDYGAQYFASHGFSTLILDDEHSFWEKEERDIAEGITTLNYGSVIKKSPKKGVRLYNLNNAFDGDRWQRAIKYYQHSYSTQLGIFLVGDGNDDHPNQSGISEDKKNWLYRKDPRKLVLGKKHSISSWDIELKNEYRCFMTTHHLLFDEGEVYIIYHNAAKPLWIKFSGIATTHGGDTYTILEKLWGPKGNLIKKDTGVNIYNGDPGFYPLWSSDNKVRPLVPMIFKVEAGFKKNKSKLNVRCNNDGNQFIINWGEEEINVTLPGLTSRYKF